MVQKLFDNFARTKQICGRMALTQLGDIYDTESAKKVLGDAFLKNNFPTPTHVVTDDMGMASEQPQTDEMGQPLPYDIELADMVLKDVLGGDLGMYDVSIGEVVASEEPVEAKLAMFQEVVARAEVQAAAEPGNPNAHYWMAYALGRYAQGISIAKALAAGIGGKVRASLEHTLKLAPKHADAHIALGSYHAEIIDKVGSMVGGLTYGAKKDIGLGQYESALKLNPGSAIARIASALAFSLSSSSMGPW
jgi:hypothetical protein